MVSSWFHGFNRFSVTFRSILANGKHAKISLFAFYSRTRLAANVHMYIFRLQI